MSYGHLPVRGWKPMRIDPGRAGSSIVRWFSFESFASNSRRGNGGGVIAARAAMVALVTYSLTVALLQLLGPSSACDPSCMTLRQQCARSLPTLGAAFAAAYVAFYARFSSQWTYLAGVYNQIKAAEVRGVGDNNVPLAQWKAGFIEDADELHLARKPLFASVIRAWGNDEDVKRQYDVLTAGRGARWKRIMEDANLVFAEENKRGERKMPLKER